jgi:hypothetical protein
MALNGSTAFRSVAIRARQERARTPGLATAVEDRHGASVSILAGDKIRLGVDRRVSAAGHRSSELARSSSSLGQRTGAEGDPRILEGNRAAILERPGAGPRGRYPQRQTFDVMVAEDESAALGRRGRIDNLLGKNDHGADPGRMAATGL